jgi:hypothetical protein
VPLAISGMELQQEIPAMPAALKGQRCEFKQGNGI